MNEMAKQDNKNSGKTYVVIAYDICDEKRLQRLHRRLKKYGIAVQYSIFEAILSRAELEEMQKMIGKLIKPKQGDRVRYFFLCESCRRRIQSTDGLVLREKSVIFV